MATVLNKIYKYLKNSLQYAIKISKKIVRMIFRKRKSDYKIGA